MADSESSQQFETRKADHIRVAMDSAVQSIGSGFDDLSFLHEALPEIDFGEVSISNSIFSARPSSVTLRSPFFVSSMTAGHAGSLSLNRRLAEAAFEKGWAMGVGSQRRELSDASASKEWTTIRANCPGVVLFGNIGLSQLIHTDTTAVQKLADALQAKAMIVHLNPLQEALQIEGTPNFRGGLKAIETLVREIKCPVVVKETGCGISGPTARRLIEAGVHAIDVAGRGGTHWGRIEGLRAASAASAESSAGAISERAMILSQAAMTMRDWGLSTVDSIRQVASVVKASGGSPVEIWASGGVRSGLDAAKALALGANAVGVAQPLMAGALEGEDALRQVMDRFEFELKTVLFCVGARDIAELRARASLIGTEKGGAV